MDHLIDPDGLQVGLDLAEFGAIPVEGALHTQGSQRVLSLTHSEFTNVTSTFDCSRKADFRRAISASIFAASRPAISNTLPIP
jgi:hypothetical protein